MNKCRNDVRTPRGEEWVRLMLNTNTWREEGEAFVPAVDELWLPTAMMEIYNYGDCGNKGFSFDLSVTRAVLSDGIECESAYSHNAFIKKKKKNKEKHGSLPLTPRKRLFVILSLSNFFSGSALSCPGSGTHGKARYYLYAAWLTFFFFSRRPYGATGLTVDKNTLEMVTSQTRSFLRI